MQLPQLRDKEHDMRAMIEQVSRHLELLEEQHADTSAMITNLQNDLRALPNIVKLDRNLDTLTDLMNRVNTADTQLTR
jgi:chromosome segregation ATPase